MTKEKNREIVDDYKYCKTAYRHGISLYGKMLYELCIVCT